MSRPIIYDDFVGFTFNGRHCSEFGLLRTSDGDRYEDDLVLSLSDEAAEVPGSAGEYYWGETIKSREFKIPVAYDGITELEKREIRKWLHPDDKLHELIFDEKPYIKYWVKCSKQVAAKELCFNENGKRIYKGEFDIEFIAYMPYGVEVWRSIELDIIDQAKEPEDKMGNFWEWYDASGLLTDAHYIPNMGGVDAVRGEPPRARLHNPGDTESGFELILEKDSQGIKAEQQLPDRSNKVSHYEKIENTLIDIKNDSYYIFSPYLSKIHGEDNSAVSIEYNDSVIDEGYIDASKSSAQFVSTNSGKAYDIFYLHENDDNFTRCNYSFSEELEDLKLYYALFANNQTFPFYIEGGNKVYGIDTDFKELGDFTVASNQEENFECYIELYNSKTSQYEKLKGYSFKLTIPQASNTKPSEYTEAQKMWALNCQIKIDTLKQIIQYREIIDGQQKIYGDWIGVSGIITEGTLFKIPLVKYNEAAYFVFEGLGSDTSIFKPYPSFYYPFLYI